MTRAALRPLVDVVLEVRSAPRPARLALAFAIAGGLHGAFFLWARRTEPSLEDWAAHTAARLHVELTRVEAVELPPTPPAPPPPEPKPSTPPPMPTPAAPRAVSAPPPPSPAQAGALLAREPDGPVDLTETTFVAGEAERYAGGVTAVRGRSDTAVHGDVGTAPPASPGPEVDRSTPVGLEEGRWSCPWPQEAEDDMQDEQLVVLRVTVAEDGAVRAVELIDDPGHGFGAAAVHCAWKTRFTPARDAAGRSVAARSPPIRVRFLR